VDAISRLREAGMKQELHDTLFDLLEIVGQHGLQLTPDQLNQVQRR